MSHELNLAIALPVDPVLLAAPVGMLVALLAIVVLRKMRRKRAMSRVWGAASHELGIELGDGTDLGPIARGKVNGHVVTVSPTSGRGRKSRQTEYHVQFEAPEAPQFRLVKRTDLELPTLDTGNPKFDAVVAIQTEQPVLLARYLTPIRRAAILRLLTYWPAAEITNRDVRICSPGMELDQDKFVDTICHLVASAETFDRPTTTHVAPKAAPAAPATDQPAAVTSSDDASTSESSEPIEAIGVETPAATEDIEQIINGDSDVLTEVRLDEATVLNDLFNSGLDDQGIESRFQQVYKGREVNWTGEVVRVAPIDGRGRQRIATFIGSADGQTPNSGRVVALTAVDPEPVMTPGDVVSFSGTLVNLDATQRLFHVV